MSSPKSLLIGVAVFTLFILSGIFLVEELWSKDPTSYDSNKFVLFNESFNRMEEVSGEITSIEDRLEGADNSKFGSLGVLNSLVSTAWQILKLMFTSLGFVKDMLLGMTMFGVPLFVPVLLGLIISVVIAFSIIAAIFNRDL